MKKFCIFLAAVAMICSLTGCSISSNTLEDMCHDYAMVTTKEDMDIFMQTYRSKMTADCIYELIGEEHGTNEDISRTLMVYSSAFDRAEHRYAYFAYRVSNIGFSNDVYVTVTLTEDNSKVESIKKSLMFSAPF